VAGSLSDRIGRNVTLALMLGFQSILMLGFREHWNVKPG
jgi:hypothetical protein